MGVIKKGLEIEHDACEVSQQEQLDALAAYLEVAREKILTLQVKLSELEQKMALLDDRMAAAEARHLKSMDAIQHLAEMILRQIGLKEPSVTVREFLSK